jgi:hypothetical protein
MTALTNTLEKKETIKIKIFEPLSNKNWLEEKVNKWLSEHTVEVLNINVAFSDDKFILTLLYKDKEEY